MKIKAVLFGSTGMIGQAVLLECIENSQVESVLLLNRHPSTIKHSKVKEIIHKDFMDLTPLASELSKYDSCFYSLGISAVGLSEEKYNHITYEIGVSIANALLNANKDYTLCYISGKGTDSTEKGRVMWARIKGKLENKLLSMPFKNAYMFRPGYIQPMKGIKSKTGWYNLIYTVFKPLYFVLKPLKNVVTNSDALAKAMVHVTLNGYYKKVIENKDINKIAESLI